jgi:hypothetical protein
MDHETKVHTLAHMLANGHGGAAPIVALERARECREARDHASAMTWLEVALLLGRDVTEGSDIDVSGGASHHGLVTVFRRHRHHKA